ncbi:MAG: bifunctional heptose 7-phosphate kinase/heptose 1-phosphate adenyltransferase [Sulfurimonas sp.]|nr:MAG: bifunctional heptose 7-phosphate kinase/heptose 1-phosphate adenyltransferase [Sulfurimonas sp.]
MIEIFRANKPNILVIGDLMIDHYLWGGCERISPEAPVQVVDIKNETTVLGGAGNVLNNLLALGARVGVAGVIGDDSNGRELALMLKSSGVQTEALLCQKARITSRKSRIIASNQQVLRYDKESTTPISNTDADRIIAAIEKDIWLYDMIVISDYAKGVVTPYLAQGILSLSRREQKKVIVDPKGSDFSKYTGAYMLTPNKKEAVLATGIDIVDDDSLKAALMELQSTCQLHTSMVTLSEEGLALYDDHLRHFPTVAREIYDVTGAGDTVIASLAFALASGSSVDMAAQFANYAAAVVVGKVGSATATMDEIEMYVSSLHQSDSQTRIKSFDAIDAIVRRAKAQGQRIVFTNGCFDILHVGHVKYLQAAKHFGDLLIVGLNADVSVRSLKGESRPINTQEDRAHVLAALDAVDYVVIFSDETPYELIKMIAPHTLVKGGDYEGRDVVGTEFAHELKLVPFVEGKSTSKTIEKIEGNRC